MQDRSTQAVTALKQAKSQGLSYYDATQILAKQGFNPEEIEQASYQFTYSDATPAESASTNPAIDQAFAEGVVHEEAVANAKQELHDDVAGGLLGGGSLIGSYNKSKAIGDYAALKELESNGRTAPVAQGKASNGGGRVFSRNRTIRSYAFISLVPLIALAPFCLGLVISLPSVIITIIHHHDKAELASIGFYLWSAMGYLTFICIALLLFLAHKESTIVKTIYTATAIDFVLFVAFAILFRYPMFLVFGIITIIPGFWISKRVGLLLQLS